MFSFAQPQIPVWLLRDMVQLISGGSYDKENGNQWRPTKPSKKIFKGIVLPVSNEDLQNAPPGTFTANSKKLYTNGHQVKVGSQFTDPFDNITYTITQELTYGPVHPMKRYAVESKGVSASK